MASKIEQGAQELTTHQGFRAKSDTSISVVHGSVTHMFEVLHAIQAAMVFNCLNATDLALIAGWNGCSDQAPAGTQLPCSPWGMARGSSSTACSLMSAALRITRSLAQRAPFQIRHSPQPPSSAGSGPPPRAWRTARTTPAPPRSGPGRRRARGCRSGTNRSWAAWQTSGGGTQRRKSPPTEATKKPRRWQGRTRESGPQSGLGRCAQRSGDALAQAAGPTEGGTSSEQGQGAGNISRGRSRIHSDRIASTNDGPSSE